MLLAQDPPELSARAMQEDPQVIQRDCRKTITPRRLECQPCFRLVALATGQAVLPLTAIQLRVYVERLTALLAAGADTNATQWEYPYFTAMHAAINELEDAASSRC